MLRSYKKHFNHTKKIQILSHLLTCKLLKSLSFFTSKTIFCDFSANKTIKYTLMFK